MAALLDEAERHARAAQQAGPAGPAPAGAGRRVRAAAAGAGPARRAHPRRPGRRGLRAARRPPAGRPRRGRAAAGRHHPAPAQPAVRAASATRPGSRTAPTAPGSPPRCVLDGDPPAAVGAPRSPTRLGTAARRAERAAPSPTCCPNGAGPSPAGTGLRTVIGRAGRRHPLTLAFDDATPHWLVGGRTGAGKTVFLLDVLYGLAARYAPAELQLYLLDFKEGVSFTEFVPTERDPSWLPHARAVGIESDREYGLAVLRELRRELTRRADRAQAARRHQARRPAPGRPSAAPDRRRHRRVPGAVRRQRRAGPARPSTCWRSWPARAARTACTWCWPARARRGIEALYGRAEAIFGQFPLRVALPGGGGVLDPLNDAADGAAGRLGGGQHRRRGGRRRTPWSASPTRTPPPADLAALRHELWAGPPGGLAATRRLPGVRDRRGSRTTPPGPGCARAATRRSRWSAATVDVAGSTAAVHPGRHPGPAPGRGRHRRRRRRRAAGRHPQPGPPARSRRRPASCSPRWSPPPTELADDTGDDPGRRRPPGRAPRRGRPARTASPPSPLAGPSRGRPRPDLPGGVRHGRRRAPCSGATDPATFRSGHDDLRALLRQGPGHGVHLLGWWRGLRRLADDLGGTQNRDDVACLVALNVPGVELGLHLGVHDLSLHPARRPGAAGGPARPADPADRAVRRRRARPETEAGDR